MAEEEIVPLFRDGNSFRRLLRTKLRESLFSADTADRVAYKVDDELETHLPSSRSLVAVWGDENLTPDHKIKKERLRREWPELARELDRLLILWVEGGEQ